MIAGGAGQGRLGQLHGGPPPASQVMTDDCTSTEELLAQPEAPLPGPCWGCQGEEARAWHYYLTEIVPLGSLDELVTCLGHQPVTLWHGRPWLMSVHEDVCDILLCKAGLRGTCADGCGKRDYSLCWCEAV